MSTAAKIRTWGRCWSQGAETSGLLPTMLEQYKHDGCSQRCLPLSASTSSRLMAAAGRCSRQRRPCGAGTGTGDDRRTPGPALRSSPPLCQAANGVTLRPGPGCGFTEEPAVGVGPVTLVSGVVPACPACRLASAISRLASEMRRLRASLALGQRATVVSDLGHGHDVQGVVELALQVDGVGRTAGTAFVVGRRGVVAKWWRHHGSAPGGRPAPWRWPDPEQLGQGSRGSAHQIGDLGVGRRDLGVEGDELASFSAASRRRSRPTSSRW